MTSMLQPLTSETFPSPQWDPQSLTCQHWTPEQHLQAEVLLGAWTELHVADYPYRPRSRRLVRETMEWVEREDHAWPFSSVSICSSLGLHIDAIRKAFRAIVAKRELSPPPQGQTEYVSLANKLLQQLDQPEIFPCESFPAAVRKRNLLATCVPRALDDPRYKFHTRIEGSAVWCWIEEWPKRCQKCEARVVTAKSLCRSHLRTVANQAARMKKKAALQKENI
jgi:hypothetical protein